MIENLHKAFKGSRGAAAGCAVLDARSHGVVFAGVGNPNFRILSSSQSTTLPVSDGIIGREIRIIKTFGDVPSHLKGVVGLKFFEIGVFFIIFVLLANLELFQISQTYIKIFIDEDRPRIFLFIF